MFKKSIIAKNSFIQGVRVAVREREHAYRGPHRGLRRVHEPGVGRRRRGPPQAQDQEGGKHHVTRRKQFEDLVSY